MGTRRLRLLESTFLESTKDKKGRSCWRCGWRLRQQWLSLSFLLRTQP